MGVIVIPSVLLLRRMRYRTSLALLPYGCNWLKRFCMRHVPDVTICEPDAAAMPSPYVYWMNYRLSKETMARVERQLRLLDERVLGAMPF